MNKIFFSLYHALGNKYIVLEKINIDFKLTKFAIQNICDKNFGFGSDGILLKVDSTKADFGLKIFNSDGTEAEISGNGLRIFSKYLFDNKFTIKRKFSIETLGGIVNTAIVSFKDKKVDLISIDMGTANFNPSKIPVNIYKKEVIDTSIFINNSQYLINCVSIGNPHCVIIKDNLDISEIKENGKYLESHDIFPNKTNVQFVKIITRKKVEALIWERGAGFTLASGSSACAIAAVLKKKKLINNQVTISMVGGEIEIGITDKYSLTMTGSARQIAEGNINQEFIEEAGTKKLFGF